MYTDGCFWAREIGMIDELQRERMMDIKCAKSPRKAQVDTRRSCSEKDQFKLMCIFISNPIFKKKSTITGESTPHYGFAEAGQWGWSISPRHFPDLTARLRLRLINHPASALLLCFLFKCRIDGFLLHFIDLCIMVLSLLYQWEGARRCRRACPGKDGRPGLCVAYCSAWRN